jgi:hypothetical protein
MGGPMTSEFPVGTVLVENSTGDLYEVTAVFDRPRGRFYRIAGGMRAFKDGAMWDVGEQRLRLDFRVESATNARGIFRITKGGE